MSEPRNILFLCTGNSARSVIAEAILNRMGGGAFHAYSAGSQPKGQVNPNTIKLLRALGYDTSTLRSKSWNEFAQNKDLHIDCVITVCNNAAGEACPVIPGKPAKQHWDIPDPAAVSGTLDEIEKAFKDVHEMLVNRIAALVKQTRET
jgi:protein-tyrosine-phosphatase